MIGREQVCSSWYGRRQSDSLFSSTESSSSFSLHSTSVSSKKKRAPRNSIGKSQIKNIKLLIVTDIKVRIDSSSHSGFRFGWGRAFQFSKKGDTQNCTIVFSQLIEKIVPDVSASFLQQVGKANRTKSLRHQVFPGGPPSKYYPGPTMLNCCDRTRTGVFIVVWP